jgi:plastocyanin
MISRSRIVAVTLGVSCLLAMPSHAANHVVQVIDIAFTPSDLTIQVGDTVTFQKTNTGVPHNVRSDGFTNGCTQSATCFRSGGATTGSFTFGPLDVFNTPGTFRYFCEVHGGQNGAGMSGRIVVQDDTPPPPPPPPPPTTNAGVLRFTNSNFNRAEGIGTASVNVERTGGDDGAVGVSYSTSNGTATAGQDYIAASGTLSWADGEDGIKSFNVQITQDASDENNETVNLQLSDATGGAGLGSPSTATLTIVDDDNPTDTGTVHFTHTTYNVGETVAQATVGVSRTGGAQGAASVDYDTSNGTATAGQDYTAVSGTLNWSNGDAAEKAFNVPILDDTAFEGDETVGLALSQPSGATLGSPAAATLTINDNDTTPPCTDGDFQVCLLGRFLATIHWVRPNNQGAGEGRVTKLTDSAASFEFFEAGNVEVVLKMKDACALPAGNPLRNFWPFVAGLTNVRVELTIIDTQSGVTRRFFNALGAPFFTPATDSPDGKTNPPGAIQATTEALGAFPTCDA